MNAPESAVAVASLPLAHIAPSPTNPRQHFDEDYLAELAETIRSHGVLQPITVRPNPHHRAGKPIYEIVVGECRWRAAKIAGLAEIPAFWRELDASTALLIARISGDKEQKRAVKEITEGFGGNPMSYRDAQRHLRHRFTLSLVQSALTSQAWPFPTRGGL